jgi:hypothetical protein
VEKLRTARFQKARLKLGSIMNITNNTQRICKYFEDDTDIERTVKVIAIIVFGAD